jgi:hypothetical protein
MSVEISPGLEKGNWMIKRIFVAIFLTVLATNVYADFETIQQR